jgi:osmoprotectant transport system substrate-binding protein
VSIVRRRGPWLATIAVAVGLCAASCTSSDDTGATSTAAATSAATTKGESPGSTAASGGISPDGKVVFGAFNFSESAILANIYAQAATAAGVPAEVVSVGPRELVYPQLFKGELGVVPEYSGTAVVALGGDATSDSAKTHDALVDLMKPKDVAVLDSAPAEDRNAIAVTLDTATRLNVQTMTDLARVAADLTLGGPAECPQRPLCIPGFESTYGIKFKTFVPLDSGVPTASSLARGEVGAALVFTTDASISPFTLITLDDDKGMFPADNVTPVVRQEVLDKYPQLGPALDKVSAALTTRDVRALNYTVALAGERPDQAARTWLQDQGLI